MKNEELRPQVGDVWYDDITCMSLHVKAVANTLVICTSGISNDEAAINMTYLLEGTKLIERDGKHYKTKRVFERKAYYQVITNGIQDVAQFLNGKFYGVYHEPRKPDQIDWIGEKIELEWPDLDKIHK